MSFHNECRDYIRRYYGIEVKRGLPIVFDGRPGKITGFCDARLIARLDDMPWHEGPVYLHPTWRVAYPTLGIEATA